MECNKDEALRAKEIAEKKFVAKDMAGARKFALKAQNLYPALEGVSQLVATLDVYMASELMINGERDWYAIFSVHPTVDEDTLKKQYRKLALLLHPDKNKSIGAEGAFQLISQAWSVLSDKGKRSLFDLKRSTKGPQQSTSQSNNNRSAPKAAHEAYTFAKNAKTKAKVPKSTANAAQSAAPPPSAAHPPTFPAPPNTSNSSTFWTSCDRCKMQYEYLRFYIDQTLLCPHCREPFKATESPASVNRENSSVPLSEHPDSKHNSTAKNSFGPENSVPIPSFKCGPFSRAAGVASAVASATAAAQAANLVHQTYEKVRREREEAQAKAQAATRRADALLRKNIASKRKLGGSENSNVGMAGSVPYREHPSFLKDDRPLKKKRSIGDDSVTGSEAEQTVTGIDGLSRSKLFNYSVDPSEMVRTNGFCRDSIKFTLFQLDTKKMLIEKTKATICKKLEEWKPTKDAISEEREKAKKIQKQKEAVKENVNDASSRNDTAQVPDKKDSSNGHTTEADDEVIEPVTIDVPDPDFHDFDEDRSERSFKGEQIWATYDEEDGMPRYYALVRKVISLKPFKICMSYLTSKSNSEFGTLDWVAYGFTKTSGDFRLGKIEVNDTINIFSHKVKWEKGPRGVIKIIPRKGEIWALYRNWSSDWNEHTPDDVIYNYDMVEVLEDYNEEQGIPVVPLVKVVGFKTVFHRHLDSKEVKMIPREEMFRFSHQVPSIVLTGEEAHNAPKGCYELDPAATPLDLLQVVTEAKDGEAMEIPNSS